MAVIVLYVNSEHDELRKNIGTLLIKDKWYLIIFNFKLEIKLVTLWSFMKLQEAIFIL